MCTYVLSRVQLFETPWAEVRQTPLSFPSPGCEKFAHQLQTKEWNQRPKAQQKRDFQ